MSFEEKLRDPRVRSWRAIFVLFQSLCSHLEVPLAKEGLSIPRFQVFFWLYFEGPLSGADLSRKLLVTRGNTSSFMKRLLEEEWVVKTPLPDSRRYQYELTKKAKKKFEKVFPDHIDRICQRVPALEEATIDSLLKVSEDLRVD